MLFLLQLELKKSFKIFAVIIILALLFSIIGSKDSSLANSEALPLSFVISLIYNKIMMKRNYEAYLQLPIPVVKIAIHKVLFPALTSMFLLGVFLLLKITITGETKWSDTLFFFALMIFFISSVAVLDDLKDIYRLNKLHGRLVVIIPGIFLVSLFYCIIIDLINVSAYIGIMLTIGVILMAVSIFTFQKRSSYLTIYQNIGRKNVKSKS